MDIDLSGKTALVTGGSRGIGRAIVKGLAGLGATVFAVARRPGPLAEAVAEISAGTNARVEGLPCDVSDAAEVAAVAEAVRQRAGGIDILVNNAGNSMKRPVASLTADEMIDDFGTKVLSALRFSQFAIPHMRERRWGRIINVVSVNGKAPGNAQAPSAISRSAGITLTKIMATELGPSNITVNALCVGRIKSDQWANWHKREAPELSYDEFLASRAGPIPLGRLGEPEEFAAVACFLASNAASYVTGVALNVDGGLCPVP